MGCASSRGVRTFYHQSFEEQPTVSSVCERGEPEGSANADKSSKENQLNATKKPIPYVPVDDLNFSCPNTDFSISYVFAPEDKAAVSTQQRDLVMQAEDIL